LVLPSSTCPADCPSIPPGPAGHPAEHRFVTTPNLRFHTVQQGDGPVVLLLHGFPEFWYSWRHQLPALSGRFRAVAPDLPGYNLSEPSPGGYGLPRLVSHTLDLLDALGAARAHVVAHDWGGVIAWALAMWAPERVERLVILNAPHPGAYLRELRRNRRQRQASWYALFFQLPWLPEFLLSRDRCRPIGELLRRTAAPRAFSNADLLAYRRALCRPGALSAALAYYRALGRAGLRNLTRSIRPIATPTLIVWGQHDPALVPELADGLEAWVPDLRLVRVASAGHWVHLDRPALVNDELLRFL
jgi:pimeloyl-ACP methyl ester carboxylesterase